MNKEIWREDVFNSKELSISESFVAFVICQYTDINGNNCFMALENIAKKAKLGETTTRAALNGLLNKGWIKRELASQRDDIPKSRGYVWSIMPTPPNNDPSKSEPSKSEGSDSEPSGLTSRSKFFEKNNIAKATLTSPQISRVSTILNSTTKDGDRGRCSPSSRASAAAREEGTYSEPQSLTKDQAEQPEQPVNSAEVAAVRQALEHALPTLDLSDVRGLYKRAQTILIARGGLDAALLYIEQRGLEWTERLLKGQRYAPHAIIHLIAQDAPTWRAPRQPKTPLTAPQIAPQTHAAAPGDVSTDTLPWWWPHLLRALLDLASGHRREDSPQSRTYAALLNALADRLRNAHSALLQNYQLSIEIDALDLPQHDLDQLLTLLPILVERVAGVDCLAASLTQRQHRRAG